MALPTASTPGYTTYAGKVSCTCLAAWLPSFSRLCELKGYGVPTIWQLTGGLATSGGTHSQGGAFDIGGLGYDRAMLAREMGAWATWPRSNMPIGSNPNLHTHGVLAGCPHNYPARYQLTAVRAGYDGLGSDGRQGRDPLRPPKTYRTWSQGKAWADAEIYRIEDAMYTDADRARDVQTNQLLRLHMGQEGDRYSDFVARFDRVLSEMAADDLTPVTIDPANVATVAATLAQKVLDSLPKAPGA